MNTNCYEFDIMIIIVVNTYRLGVISTEEKPGIYNGMKEKFIAEFEKIQAERDEMEVNINNKASNSLKEAERELAASCPEYGLSKSMPTTIIVGS